MKRVALTIAALVACGDGEPAVDPALLARVRGPAPAALAHPVDADLGGVVTYLGNDVAAERVVAGGQARVVHYWKVVAPPGDVAVFAHLTSDGGDFLNVDASELRAGYPPRRWRPGEVLRDEHAFTLPSWWRADHATLVVGLYRAGSVGKEGRVEVRRGATDPHGRVIAARFAVERGRPVAEYAVRKARGPIRLDGVADEADWKAAPLGPAFSDAEGGGAVGGGTVARLLWDDAHLYAFIACDDADVWSSYRGRDDPLWREDVVELFIDADGNRRGYVELQVNPNGAIFDAFFPIGRAEKHHFEWNGGMRAAVVVHGTADRRDDRDRGWDVELAIPLADVKGMAAEMDVAIPPAIGDRWRLNVVRVEKPARGGIRASSWNPITIRDFHALGRMLTVVFADADGATGSRP